MNTPSVSTELLYDAAANGWRRSGPVLLSDYTARPFLLDWCDPVADAHVLDIGCGEGYMARELAKRGACKVLGIDISSEMITQAHAAGTADGRLEYRVGDVSSAQLVLPGTVDLALAAFLFNYLTVAQMETVLARVRAALRVGGRFVFAVPHPALAFVRAHEAPFYFDAAGQDYFSGRDHLFEGHIWRRDGVKLPVRSVHKTWSDYFRALRGAGFTAMPEVEELHVTEEHVQFDRAFFEPLRGTPLHVAMRVTREE
jgi:SAM-dependent methyltransferase